MSLPVKVLGAACRALGMFLDDVHDLLDPTTPNNENGHDCGPHVMTVADLIARRHDAAPQPQDAPSIAQYTWRGAFASEITEGDLIALDGRYIESQPGRRALRVTKLRPRDHDGHGHEPIKTVTVLMVDVDTERSASLTMGQDAAVEIAVQVPDTPESVFRAGEFGDEA